MRINNTSLFSFLILKRIISIIILLAFVSCSGDDTEDPAVTEPIAVFKPLFACENGMAGIYPCNKYDLMGKVSSRELGGINAEVNDSWGWKDLETGKEYAIVGTTTGTAFIDISIPTDPVVIGKLPTATEDSPWRDIKIYGNHAFIVSEAEDHGMQVFDLSRLREVLNTPKTFDADALYSGFGNAHNIVINENSGFAYVVGSDTFEGGPHFVNIGDPKNPVAAGGYAEEGYTHDAQVVNYTGPDTDYSGRELFIGSNHHGAVIVDVTDKAAPQFISEIKYEDFGFPHQGWFSEDQKYFFMGDELDELLFGLKTRTVVLDLTDLDDPAVHLEYFGPSNAIDHNGYVHNDQYYLANYTAGLRIIDVANIMQGSMEETGFFDTYPLNNEPEFKGVWSVYPYLESGNIIISDITGGLFIVKKSGT